MSAAPTSDPGYPTPDLPLLHSGKVRDTYELPDGSLLMVASDRISTYDAVHPNPIPGKGQVLTGTSVFWFERLAGIVPNHVISYTDDVPPELRGRALKVKRLEMLPLECVVRGYLAGSGWSDYRASGAVCGIELPPGLLESSELPEPIFTPATKAEVGDHDENVDAARAAEILGGSQGAEHGLSIYEQLRDLSLAVYGQAREHARARGIILADTKFEFGVDPATGAITLGDEVLTPDSSRYWPADMYEPGRAQASFDKQFVRDWAAGTGWDKSPPAPEVPPEIVAQTQARYTEAYERLTGEPFSAWLERSGATAA
ncbi:MAG: phosphoribosylaminoimidazolesuccinocarboxamide synthase [Actinobacteria bacterium]|nr:phosphoribosylaminoimidazolesuccinocarboxamide synthase [Actinomycetota bacterium]